MRRDPLERLTIRAALGLGFGLVLGLWIFTGYVLTTRLAETETQTAEITRRYMRAQDILSAVRQQINLSSIVLRDALLDPSEAAQARYRRRLEEGYQAIAEQLDGYRPIGNQQTDEQLARLRSEVHDFRQVTLQVLAEARSNPSLPASDLLARHIAPRRSTAIALSDELRALNRNAFVEHQMATAGIHRDAERQWWYGLGAALFATLAIAFLAIVYAGRLEDRLRRGRDREARHALDLQRLSARLVEAQEEERRSIARELHDEVGQVLSAISVEVELAERALRKPDEAARALAEVQQLADGAIQTVRDLSQLLRPTMLDDLGLGAAIDWLLRGMARRHVLQVELLQTGLTERLPANLEVAAFRIAQEALTNVARHARAHHCTVRLDADRERLMVTIQDDGIGFDLATASRTDGRKGLGLVGIRERARDLDGTLVVDSQPGRGTRVMVTLPIAAMAPDENRSTDPAPHAAMNRASMAHG
jgi:signal transduction histidine kinase